MYRMFIIHCSIKGHLGSFQLMAIINKGAIYIEKHSCDMLEYLLRLCPGVHTYVCWSSGNTISNFLRTPQTDFQSSYTRLQFHQHWRSVPFFFHILTIIYCHLSFWSYPFWLVGGGITGFFWFAFPWWLRILNISLGASQNLIFLSWEFFA